MYRIFLLQTFFAFNLLFAQPPERPATPLLDTIVQLAQENSVMRDSVDWDEITATMVAMHDTGGLVPATKFMLKELNDFHGRIWVDGVPHNGVIHSWLPSTMVWDSVFREQHYRFELPIYSTTIRKRYGYIRIPGLKFGESDSLHAHQIREQIWQLAKRKKLKGMIVDLRMNGGGTMYPMLSGVTDLLGTDTLGAFVNPATGSIPWTLRNHEVCIGVQQVYDYDMAAMGDGPDLTDLPVVVLQSGATASSGEVLTLAFRNRPKTYAIGEPTAGYTTGTSWEPLSEAVVLQLTMSYYADRTGEVFRGDYIYPDEQIEGGDNFRDLSQDAKVIRAMEWIDEACNR